MVSESVIPFSEGINLLVYNCEAIIICGATVNADSERLRLYAGNQIDAARSDTPCGANPYLTTGG